MLLFRMGPRYLFLRSEKTDEITSFLKSNLNGEIVSFQEGMEKSSEYSTICFITDIHHIKTRIEDANKIVLINDGSSAILSTIINNGACRLIHRVDAGPTSIIVRVPGNEKKLVDKLKTIFGGKEVGWEDGIDIGEKNDTMIVFTNKVLSGPVSDFLGPKLLIPQPARIVKDRLRLEGLVYITQSLSDSQWYEFRINIYDSNGKYKENYERLMFILSKLEIGMILGESWTKDFAIILYSVLTYQIRLFSFNPPEEIKKILMALEYTNDGERLVDFDLYYKNSKVHWGSINRSRGRKNKLDDVKKYRHWLYEKLDREDICKLEEMERNILEN